MATINWDGNDIKKTKLLYVPKHINIDIGGYILTSSYDSIFPKGIRVGTIDSFNNEVNSNFYDIIISLDQDFYNLSQVYIVNEEISEEKLILENLTTDEK